MTERILETLKRDITGLTLVPHEGGRFELSVDGDLVYSKLATGEFPEEGDIIKMLQQRQANA